MVYSAKIDAPLIEVKGITEQRDDGALIIEGLAASFDVDRQDEAFLPGALDRAVETFMATNPLLAYHHGAWGTASVTAQGIRGPELQPLGRVLEMSKASDGWHMKARVDKPAPGSWAEDIFEKIKSGTIRSLSVGGHFKRAMTEEGPRIYDVDLAEISVTPLSVGKTTTFEVVAGKAFTEPDPEVPAELLDRLAAVRETLSQLEGKAVVDTDAKANDVDKNYLVGAVQHHASHLADLAAVIQGGSSPRLRAHAKARVEESLSALRELHDMANRMGPAEGLIY